MCDRHPDATENVIIFVLMVVTAVDCANMMNVTQADVFANVMYCERPFCILLKGASIL